MAEVRDRAEGPWAKSPAPLQLQLPTVDEPLWSADQVGPGDPVEISVRAPGAPDGTPMQIEVFSRRRDGQEQSLEIFDEVVQDEHVAVQWAYTEDTKGQAGDRVFFHRDARRRSGEGRSVGELVGFEPTSKRDDVGSTQRCRVDRVDNR